MLLADAGATDYRIVVSRNPEYGEDLAAKELAYFLFGMTKVDFPFAYDTEPSVETEIIIGNTARKRLEDIPEHLRTDNWEGFTLLREGKRLYIIGNIPRATLYGVYDFLDVELGVRFLTERVNHVPDRPRLEVTMASRTYGPPIERRTIWEALGGRSVVRNRMNGHSFQVAGDRLGGVQIVGRPTHSFDALVPMDKYFDEHPEYFSLIEGQRRREYKGIITQLCLTNPEVREVALNTLRSWLEPAKERSPYSKYIVSVTVNDSANFCQCNPCVSVNREEGVKEGGTLMRFVNTIAGTLDEEYGNVSVETMVYFTQLPKKTKAASNVLVQAVYDPDWRFALDDPNSEANTEALKFFQETRAAIGNGYLYNWIKLGLYNSASTLDPRPNLRHIGRNIRIMTKYGVKGYFVQTVQSQGVEMQDLRYYLIARALWRPELDNRETMVEFCRLYYGPAGDHILRYIDFLHDNYGHIDWSGGDPFGPKGWMANSTWIYGDRYLATADAIFSDAESEIKDSSEMVQRVGECRLPVWKIKLDRAFGSEGQVMTFPARWSFRIDPEDKGLKQNWAATTDFDSWTTMGIDRHWTFQGEEHRGVAWYAVQFDAPTKTVTRPAIWFEGVDGDVDVFLDGVKVGEQKLPATAMWQHGFYIPIESSLAEGRHTLMVRVFKDHANAGIWKPVALIDMAVPIPGDLRRAGERFLAVARTAKITHISESYAGPYTQTRKMYYPKVEYFLTHGQAN